MSDEQEVVADRNFRSAYYKSLGVKGSEKSVAYLEVLLKADVFDVKKLKSFCLKHTLTVYYRPLVWKIILSVVPVFTDKDTCSFVKEQKRIEFHDLKHALEVMGRLEHAHAPHTHARHMVAMQGGRAASSKPISQQPPSPSDSKHPQHSQDHSSQSHSHQPPSPSLPISTSTQSTLSSLRQDTESPSCSTAQSGSSELGDYQPLHYHHEHKALQQAPPCTPRDFVAIFLLENNRLLSTSVNQLKWNEQVNLITIAEAFFVLFEQESEDGMYWLFSNFIKKLESLLTAKEDMREAFSQILEDIDCALFEHIKDLDGLEDTVPIERWFCQCYAKDLPESCIESLWDRVIGGSCMILVYVAVAILLSFKRKIFGFTSAERLKYFLDNIPKDHFGPVLTKAVELWESHGSPLVPTVTVKSEDSFPEAEDAFSHELYEIEDYT